jgi:predicted nucleotidyltransferase
MLLENLNIDRTRLADLCKRYGVARLEVFGSFTRGDATPESDLDILATFNPDVHTGFEFVALQQELAVLFGRPVDLFTRSSVERSPNKYFRRFALRRTEPLYGRA